MSARVLAIASNPVVTADIEYTQSSWPVLLIFTLLPSQPHMRKNWTMDTTIDQQVAMDEALVPYAQRLRIGRSNFRLLSDIKYKESTLNSRRQPLSIIMPFDSRWITRNISLIWNHSGTCYISVRGFIVNLLLNHHLKKIFLPSFVFLDTVEHTNHKKSNKMYYPQFTKVVIHHFMSKDPSIPGRNKFGALLPIELTNEEIRNSNAYKEYYAIATGAAPPKPKASVRRTKTSSDISITPPTVAAVRSSAIGTSGASLGGSS
nr:hypothetical protein [Tanacetum cinerariifolium]